MPTNVPRPLRNEEWVSAPTSRQIRGFLPRPQTVPKSGARPGSLSQDRQLLLVSLGDRSKPVRNTGLSGLRNWFSPELFAAAGVVGWSDLLPLFSVQ